MAKLVKAEFDGALVNFDEEGWVHITEISEKYGKRPNDWLSLQDTQVYIQAYCKKHNTSQNGIIKTRKGKNGGTWIHPALAVLFARWLDVDCAIWCDEQIRDILSGMKNQIDWEAQRHMAKSSNKVMSDVLKIVREREGKEVKPYHFSNESLMINEAITGVRGRRDRDGLTVEELDVVAKAENMNTALIGAGMNYQARKPIIQEFVSGLMQKVLETEVNLLAK